MRQQPINTTIERGAGCAASALAVSADMDRVVQLLACIQEIAVASPEDSRAALDRIEALAAVAGNQLAASVAELDRMGTLHLSANIPSLTSID